MDVVPRQLALAFERPLSNAWEDFLVGDANRDAVLWLDRWPDWPATALSVYGPVGCGKTHLMNAFLAQTGGTSLSLNALNNRDLASAVEAQRVLAVDDADKLVTVGLAEPLLHLYNSAKEARCCLLLISIEPPARWNIDLGDLRSRLISCPTVGIGPPDDTMISAILVKMFADRQIRVDDALIDFLVPRMERSYAAAARIVSLIDETALTTKRRVTLSLARDVLAHEEPDDDV
jgi:chromosomal replication initiation ATPase DnaA